MSRTATFVPLLKQTPQTLGSDVALNDKYGHWLMSSGKSPVQEVATVKKPFRYFSANSDRAPPRRTRRLSFPNEMSYGTNVKATGTKYSHYAFPI